VTALNTSLPEDPTDITDNLGAFNITVDQITNYTLTFEHDMYRTVVKYIWNTTFVDNKTAKVADVGMIKLPSISGVVMSTTKVRLGDVAISISDSTSHVLLKNGTTSSTAGSVGAFTIYVDATKIDALYRKEGYYENTTSHTLTLSQNLNIGNVYIEEIVPAPTTLMFGWVTNKANGQGVQDAHVSVSRDGAKWISNLTNSQGFYQFMTYPGWLKLKASKPGFFTNETQAKWIYVPAVDRHNHNISLDALLPEIYTLTGTVTDQVPNPIVGALVKLYDTNGKYVKETTTIAGGAYSMTFYDATFRLSVSNASFFTDNNYSVAQPSHTQNVQLWPVPQNRLIYGDILDATDIYPVSGATVTIYDKAAGKIYSNSTISSADGRYEIMAYPGTFAMFVDAAGYQGRVLTVTVGATNKQQSVMVWPSEKDTIKRTYTFSSDWKNVVMRENRTLTVDNASLRADADLEFGRGTLGLTNNDWSIIQAEVDSWKNYMLAQGLPEVYTGEFLAVDNHHYEQVVGTYDVKINDALGSVETTTLAIKLDINITYAMVGTSDDLSDIIGIKFNATYDTATTDNTYRLVLPEGYEMTYNKTETSKVKISGFHEVTVDPMNGTGKEDIILSASKSQNGTAKARVVDGTYYEMNSSYDNYTVVVRRGTDDGFNTTVRFSASESTDPVGSISLANFTWKWDDGTNDSYGISVSHNFTDSGEHDVNLTINETSGTNATYRNLKVFVDEEEPVAVITAVNLTLVDGALHIDEDNRTLFSGNTSTDTMFGSEKGTIQSWKWSWGDSSANETVTKGGQVALNHTYANPGTYTLRLNVTDVVDHTSATKTMQVVVKDVTAPVVNFLMLNSTWTGVTSTRENATCWFNASATSDNHDEDGNLTYTWKFGDGGTAAGMNVSHVYQLVGMINVTVEATDKAGNKANRTSPFNVGLGARPDLGIYLNTFNFDPKTVNAGESTEISFNLTNKGDADATGVSVSFYIRTDDGDDPIGETVRLYDKNGTEITSQVVKPKQNITAKMSWAPSKKGNYTIFVTVNCSEEHKTTMFDNSNVNALPNSYVVAEDPAWMPYVIVGVVVAVIAFVGLAYWLYNRSKTSGSLDEGERRKKK
jgi:PKD repeat protein